MIRVGGAALPPGLRDAFEELLTKSGGAPKKPRVAARAWPGFRSFVVDKNGIIRHYFINKRNWDSSVAKTCVRALLDE